SNIYSQDPLAKSNASQKNDNNSLLYEYVDLNQPQPQQQQPIEESKSDQDDEEVIYDVINPNNERPVQPETDYESSMYAIPKNV
ncbi:unnamed protein product, partial [Adineta steineri]